MNLTMRIADRHTFNRRVMLFLAILISGGNLLLPRGGLALLLIIMAVSVLGGITLRLKKTSLIGLYWMVIVLVLAIVRLNNIDVGDTVVRAINFGIGFMLAAIYLREGAAALRSDFETLLWPMVYQALLTVFVAFVLPGLFAYIKVGEYGFHTFLFVLNYHVTVVGAVPIVRPNGFFFEPGVLQIYLNILLLLFVIRSAPLWRIGLTFIAIATTQSSIGLLSASLIFMYFLVTQFSGRGAGLRRFLTLAVAIALILPATQFVQSNLEAKFTGRYKGSSTARIYDLTSGLLIIQKYPVFGIGFSHAEYLDLSLELNPYTEMLSSESQNGRTNSNGLVQVVYSVGIPLAVLFFFALYNQPFIGPRPVFFGVLLLSLNGEALGYSPIFLLFTFAGFATIAGRRIAKVGKGQSQTPEPPPPGERQGPAHVPRLAGNKVPDI